MTEAAEIDRKAWMSTLAKARPGRLADLMPDLPPHETLRPPEIGAVMVRGRIGATGAPFNLGEMTVTRCAVRLGCGTLGQAWVQGRDRGHAHRAALLDAMMQTASAADLRTRVIAVLEAEARAEKAGRASKAAATKVDFFTLVRGEDQ